MTKQPHMSAFIHSLSFQEYHELESTDMFNVWGTRIKNIPNFNGNRSSDLLIRGSGSNTKGNAKNSSKTVISMQFL